MFSAKFQCNYFKSYNLMVVVVVVVLNASAMLVISWRRALRLVPVLKYLLAMNSAVKRVYGPYTKRLCLRSWRCGVFYYRQKSPLNY